VRLVKEGAIIIIVPLITSFLFDDGEMVEVTRLLVKRDELQFNLILKHKEKGIHILRVHASIILIFA
jgi:hypothetical protein